MPSKKQPPRPATTSRPAGDGGAANSFPSPSPSLSSLESFYVPLPITTAGWAIGRILVPSAAATIINNAPSSAAVMVSPQHSNAKRSVVASNSNNATNNNNTNSSSSCATSVNTISVGGEGTFWQVVDESLGGIACSPADAARWAVLEPAAKAVTLSTNTTAPSHLSRGGGGSSGAAALLAVHQQQLGAVVKGLNNLWGRIVVSQQVAAMPADNGRNLDNDTSNSKALERYNATVATDLFGGDAEGSLLVDVDSCSAAGQSKGGAGGLVRMMTVKACTEGEAARTRRINGFVTTFAVGGGNGALGEASPSSSLALMVSIVGFPQQQEQGNEGDAAAALEASWSIIVNDVRSQLFGSGDCSNHSAATTPQSPQLSAASSVGTQQQGGGVSGGRPISSNLFFSTDVRAAGASVLSRLSSTPRMLTLSSGGGGAAREGSSSLVAGLCNAATSLSIDVVPYTNTISAAAGKNRRALPTNLFEVDQATGSAAPNPSFAAAIGGIQSKLREAVALANPTAAAAKPSSSEQHSVLLSATTRQKINSLMEGAMAACGGLGLTGARVSRINANSSAGDEKHMNTKGSAALQWDIPPRLRQPFGLRVTASGDGIARSDSCAAADIPSPPFAVVPLLLTMLAPPRSLQRKGPIAKGAPLMAPARPHAFDTALYDRWVEAVVVAMGGGGGGGASPSSHEGQSSHLPLLQALWLPSRRGGGATIGTTAHASTYPTKATHIPFVMPPPLPLVAEAGGCSSGNIRLSRVLFVKNTSEEDSIVFVFTLPSSSSSTSCSFTVTYSRVHDARSIQQLFDVIIAERGAVPPPKSNKGSAKQQKNKKDRYASIDDSDDDDATRDRKRAAFDAAEREAEDLKYTSGVCEIGAKLLPSSSSSSSPSSMVRAANSAAAVGGYLCLQQYATGKPNNRSVRSTHWWARPSSCGAAGHSEIFSVALVEAVGVGEDAQTSASSSNASMIVAFCATFAEWTRAHVGVWLQ